MNILITNDDGIHSGGIIELAREMHARAHRVFIVAPRTEQSGISQAITFLKPLFPVRLGSSIELDDEIEGYSIDGTPVDCTRLALFELCPFQPDLVLSGINGGLNAGLNVGHSGTVGGALAAAAFNLPAMAISLEHEPEMDFRRAAEIAGELVDLFHIVDWPEKTVLNINIPTAALDRPADVAIVPVETNPLGYHFDRGVDPKGRAYFWANDRPDPQPSPFETDTQALRAGKISVSAISGDYNNAAAQQRFERVNVPDVAPDRESKS